MIHVWLLLYYMERTAQGLTLHRGYWDSCLRIAQSVLPKNVISGESQEGQRDYCRIWDPSERLVTRRPERIVIVCVNAQLRNFTTSFIWLQYAVLWAGTDFIVVCESFVFTRKKRLLVHGIQALTPVVHLGWGYYWNYLGLTGICVAGDECQGCGMPSLYIYVPAIRPS